MDIYKRHPESSAFRFMRWFGRFLALGFTILWIMFFSNEPGTELDGTSDILLFILFPLLPFVGYVVGWWLPLHGALTGLIGMLLFFIGHLMVNASFPFGMEFLIFVLPFVIYLIAFFLRPNRGKY